MPDAKLFGVVGGMGTAAGLAFLDALMETCVRHGVAGDQDYPEWVYFNASLAPDRTAAILGGGPSPVPYLVSVMRRMQAAGVCAAVVACNTAHHFYDEIHRQVPIPWVHLQLETAAAIQSAGLSGVGILATEGTNRTRLYSRAMEMYGLVASEPDPDSSVQAKVTRAIFCPRIGIKATGSRVSAEARELLSEAIAEMQVEALVPGCTELSLAFQQMDLGVRWFDPLEIAAEVLYALWRGERAVASLRDKV